MEDLVKVEFKCTKTQAQMLNNFFKYVCEHNYHIPNDEFKNANFLNDPRNKALEMMMPSYLKAILDEIRTANFDNPWRLTQLIMMLETETHNAENDNLIDEEQAQYIRSNYMKTLENL